MSDIVAHLQVLSQETGCLLDLTTILDAAICPKIDIKTEPRHHVKDEGDYICVTPSEQPKKRAESCEKCFEVDQQVCKKNTVLLDLELLVLLNLLTEADLEAYLKQMGTIPPNGHMGNGNGGNGNGSGGNGNGNGGNGNGNGSGGNGNGNGNGDNGNGSGGQNKTSLLEPLLSIDAGGKSGLANVQLGSGKDKILDLGVGKDGKLLTLDLGGKNVLTLRDEKLLDVQVGGEAKHDAAIDVNLLTQPGPHGRDVVSKRGEACETCYEDGHYLTHYQPICNKSFKQEHRANAHHCHADDVNHCLAICNAQSALVSISAGSIADIQVCAGIEFDSSTGDDNCYYYVNPESDPCEADQLEDSETCYTFIRN